MSNDTFRDENEFNPEPTLVPHLGEEFSRVEKRNIAFFIAGLMCYKFAFESLGGSVNQFVLDRISGPNGVSTLSLLVIFYGISQSLGSILVSQLVRVFRAAKVIGFFIGLFASLALLYILLEASTGGTMNTMGSWNPYLIFPIYISMGGCLGVMELVRRVIPSNIVGTNPEKLKKMDATVHIFYEVAGTTGAFASSPMLKYLGPVYATFLIPPLFLTAAILYWRVQHDDPIQIDEPVVVEFNKGKRILNVAKEGARNYFSSLVYGSRIVVQNRQFVWLIFGYVLPLVIHRLVENLLFSIFAKKILLDGSLSQILLGGSNFGELCGAALVLRFSKYIKSPLPWVRIDAITISVLWILPYASASQAVALACGLIPAMMVLSGAWAAGDVSLLAYIQANLPEEEDAKSKISPLGAVMGFLYASYVILSTFLIYGLGRAFDYFIAQGDVRQGFFWVSGVGFSIAGVIIFASTFVPKGSWKLNPYMLGPTTSSRESDMEASKKGTELKKYESDKKLSDSTAALISPAHSIPIALPSGTTASAPATPPTPTDGSSLSSSQLSLSATQTEEASDVGK